MAGSLGRLWEGVAAEVERLRRAHPAATLYFTGHSKGGALANLAAILARRLWPEARVKAVTFGAARTGDSDFVRSYNEAGIECHRYEVTGDKITDLPPGHLPVGTAHILAPIPPSAAEPADRLRPGADRARGSTVARPPGSCRPLALSRLRLWRECLRAGVPARLALNGSASGAASSARRRWSEPKVGSGIGAQVERLGLVAEPDPDHAPGSPQGLALLDREVTDRPIGIGAGLDPSLEQMLALDDDEPAIGEQDRAGRSDDRRREPSPRRRDGR